MQTLVGFDGTKYAVTTYRCDVCPYVFDRVHGITEKQKPDGGRCHVFRCKGRLREAHPMTNGEHDG